MNDRYFFGGCMHLTVSSIAILLLVVMAGFQNCAQPNKIINSPSGVTAGEVNSGSSAEYRKTAASSYDALTLMDDKNFRNIEIDLSSGKARSISLRTNKSLGDLCLKPEDLKPVTDLLKQSDVCEPLAATKPQEGRICTQVYVYPYAALGEGGQKIMLGEKVDGCAPSVDLCAEKASQLKALAQNILSYVDQRICQ